MRRTVAARRGGTTLPWVRPATLVRLDRALSADAATEPVRWDSRVRWFARRRALRVTLRCFELLANDFDVLAVHPFADRGFLDALARQGGWSGFGDRTATMRNVFAGLLPDDVLSRQTKASLNAVFWNRYSREFTARWTGGGVDGELVDPDRLRTEWSRRAPHAHTSTLFQAAWLAEADGATEGYPADERREAL
jgi:hypothetical protein